MPGHAGHARHGRSGAQGQGQGQAAHEGQERQPGQARAEQERAAAAAAPRSQAAFGAGGACRLGRRAAGERSTPPTSSCPGLREVPRPLTSGPHGLDGAVRDGVPAAAGFEKCLGTLTRRCCTWPGRSWSARRRSATQAWVVDGRVTYDRPPAADRGRADGRAAGCCPAWSTRTATSGSDAHGAVDRATSEQQAAAPTATAGTLLLRDAGSPADTRWVDDREDLPRHRPGRAAPRPHRRRYIRNFAHEIEPEDLGAYVAAGGPPR